MNRHSTAKRVDGKPMVLLNAVKLHQGPQRLPTGNFQHVLNLVGELALRDEISLRVLTDLDSHHELKQRIPEQCLEPTSLRGNSISAADAAVVRAVRRLRPDLYHRPTGQLPFVRLPCRTVSGIADLSYLALPHPWLKRLYKQISYRWTVKVADRIICVSRFTRDDVAARLHGSPEKLRVVHLGANILPPPDPVLLSKVPSPYFLAFAHQSHKNAELCLRALVQVRTSGLVPALILVGQNEYIENQLRPMAAELKLRDSVYFIGVPTAGQLSAWYQGASGLLFPSRYEGFGLPVLEAMQVGCPVICSNVCSLPEVAGEAALMFAPDDLPGFCEAMLRLLRDDGERARLVAAGRRRAAEFTWVKSAAETVAVYQELLPTDQFALDRGVPL